MDFCVIIPARYASTRLPGKPLRKIGSKPLIWHVYQRALESGASEILVATDDERIQSVVESFGGQVQMTDPAHRSGTERLAEVAASRGYSSDRIIVNLQGDEPDTPSELIHQVAGDLAKQGRADMSTACTKITSTTELFDPHVVKVIRNSAGFAMYFSRAPIPWDREVFSVTTEQLPHQQQHYRHIGIYAYRAGFLQQYVQWQDCELEQMESLEQLRVLWYGGRIFVADALRLPGHGIDTENDLMLANQRAGE